MITSISWLAYRDPESKVGAMSIFQQPSLEV